MQLIRETNLYDDEAISKALLQTVSNIFYDENMFNILTHNGAIQGLFWDNGQVYANMNYLRTGTLVLGGVGNVSGTMIVNDANDNEIGRFDNTGIKATGDLAIVNDYASLVATNTYVFYPYSYTDIRYGLQNVIMAYADNHGSPRYKCKHAFLPQGESHVENNPFYTRSIRTEFDPDSTSASTSAGTLCSEVVRYGVISWTVVNYSSGGNQAYFTVGHSAIEWNYGVNTNAYYYLSDATNTGNGRFKIHCGSTNAIDFEMVASATGPATMFINASYATINGKTVQLQSSSATRYKHDITQKITADLDAHKLYKLPMKQFVFNDDHLVQYNDMKGKTIPGFIAEDVDKIYPAAVIHDEEGNIESWDERRIIPGMLALIQEQKKQIDDLQETIDKFKQIIHVA